VKVQRRQPTDAVTRDGETAVLVGGHAVRLSPLSSEIFDLTGEPITVEELARQLEARFGAPQGRSTHDATKDAVADMVHHGVLRESS
jgi:hypothetical protein